MVLLESKVNSKRESPYQFNHDILFFKKKFKLWEMSSLYMELTVHHGMSVQKLGTHTFKIFVRDPFIYQSTLFLHFFTNFDAKAKNPYVCIVLV